MHHPRPDDRSGHASRSPPCCFCSRHLRPSLSWAQTSPFMTGATALQTNIIAWLTPVAIILIMVLGGMAMANRMSWGWCLGAILGNSDRLRSAANRHLGARDVRSLGGRHERTQSRTRSGPLFVGATRPPMRWGVTYSALLFNMVFAMEAFLVTKNLLTLLLALPIHGICALLCARDARFFDLVLLWAPYALARGVRQSTPVEGEQLFARWRLISRIMAGADGSSRSMWCVPTAPRRSDDAGPETFRGTAPGIHGGSTHPVSGARGPRASSAPNSETICRPFGWAARVSRAAMTTQLNNWHERLNVLWRNIASPECRALDACHSATRSGSMESEQVRTSRRGRSRSPTEAGLSPRSCIAGTGSGWATRRSCSMSSISRFSIGRLPAGRPVWCRAHLPKTQRDGWRAELADALDACEKLAQTLAASLARYEPEPLRLLPARPAVVLLAARVSRLCCSMANGSACRCRADRFIEAWRTTRLFFGTEAIEYRSPHETRVGAMLGIKEYPTPTAVGMYDRLLSAPLSFVLTQSFTFLSKASGQVLLQRQFNRMANAGDFAVSQAEELKDALDALTSNEFVMGDHHFSLQLFVDITGRRDRPAGRHD